MKKVLETEQKETERRTPAFAPKPASFFSRAHPLPAGARDFKTLDGRQMTQSRLMIKNAASILPKLGQGLAVKNLAVNFKRVA